MADNNEPTVTDAARMSPSGSHDPDNVLADLRGIMQQAGEQYYSEQRLDVSNEVADSVRFVQASMLWQERITPHVQLKFHLAHDYLPVVEGHVLWVSRRFLCVRGGQHEFLINLEHIVAVTGLPSVGLAVTSSAVIDQMESIWLGGVLEDQQLASWYVSLDQVFVGACTRLGMDAVDVQTDRLSVTVMFKYVVAVRIALQG